MLTFCYFKLCTCLVFSFFHLVCESCIEPVPLCSEGEILTVDLNTIHYCCPHYYCGECNCWEFDMSPNSVKMTVHGCAGICLGLAVRVGLRYRLRGWNEGVEVPNLTQIQSSWYVQWSNKLHQWSLERLFSSVDRNMVIFTVI